MRKVRRCQGVFVRINTGDISMKHLFFCKSDGLVYLRMSQAPKTLPIKVPEHVSAQSKYEFAAALPTRSLILAPSGGGKTVLLQNMILDIYRDCFSRIYIFSPSIDVDMTWKPVMEYLRSRMSARKGTSSMPMNLGSSLTSSTLSTR